MSGEINYTVIVGDTICRKVDKIEDRMNAGFDSLHDKIDVGGWMLLSKVGELSAKVDALQATLDYHTRVANMTVSMTFIMYLAFAFYFPPIVMADKDRTTPPQLKFMADVVLFVCDCVFLMPTDE